MVNAVFPPESFAADAAEVPRTIHHAVARGRCCTPRRRQGSRHRPFYAALHHVEHHYLHELMATEDAVEGLNSFMEKRAPTWKNKTGDMMIPEHHQDLADDRAGDADQDRKFPVPCCSPGEVLVEVKGCGVCHTDLSYFYMGVRTVHPPPLSLGHEISGVVLAARQA
jgi:hypothetical protein